MGTSFSSSSTTSLTPTLEANEGEGRTALVTGANSGLGYETAAQLVAVGFTVILGVRSDEKGAATVAALEERLGEQKMAGSLRLSVAILDVSSLSSVRSFAEAFLASDRPLHVLVCNAGIMMGPQRRSADGYDLQFATNYLGHFLLVELLLARLQESALASSSSSSAAPTPSRIVHVSSIAARRGTIRHDDLMHTGKAYSSSGAYCQSKLCQVIYSWHLAKRLLQEQQQQQQQQQLPSSSAPLLVTTNSIEPGVVATNLSKGITDSWAMRKRLENGTTVEKGARTQVLVAAHRSLVGLTGLHFKDGRVSAFPRAHFTAAHAERLFNASWRLAGLVTNPPPPPPVLPSSTTIATTTATTATSTTSAAAATTASAAAAATASPLQAPPPPNGAIREAAAAGDLASLRALLDRADAAFAASGGDYDDDDDESYDARRRHQLSLLEDRDSPESAKGPSVCSGDCSALVWAAYGGHADCALELVSRYRATLYTPPSSAFSADRRPASRGGGGNERAQPRRHRPSGGARVGQHLRRECLHVGGGAGAPRLRVAPLAGVLPADFSRGGLGGGRKRGRRKGQRARTSRRFGNER